MTTKHTHTPGPWRWVTPKGQSNLLALVGSGFRDDQSRYEGDSQICNFGNDEPYYPTEGMEPNEADRALIAAAPDLVAALGQLLNVAEDAINRLYDNQLSEYPAGNITEILDASAALSRARGEGGSHE